MVSTSFMVDTSSHPRAQLHRCVERSAYCGSANIATGSSISYHHSRMVMSREGSAPTRPRAVVRWTEDVLKMSCMVPHCFIVMMVANRRWSTNGRGALPLADYRGGVGPVKLYGGNLAIALVRALRVTFVYAAP
ncbi:hypothetical protein ABIF70_005590 [Bradyrhizobium japonicum]